MTIIDTRPRTLAERMVRSAVRATPIYIPSKDASVDLPRVVRLDMNESPYGPSPKTRAALAAFTATHRYPDFAQHDLRAALSDYASVPQERIVAGAGLDDVFMTLAHLVVDPGDEVIISEPTFGMYRPLFTLVGATVTDVPLDAAFDLDVEAVLAAVGERTKIVVICSPNNPTGNPLDSARVEAICRDAPCLVAIDEAYAEFAGSDHLALYERYDNVTLLRTMSKWAGLAGMRVGYGVMPEQLVPYLGTVVPAFHNVGLAASVAAVASLQDQDYLRSIVTRISTDRDQLIDQLRELPGVEPFPSVTNFVLMRLPVADGQAVVRRVAELGVLVRGFAHPRLRDALRVSIGTPAENECFLAALETALTETHA